jgi:hypothetical protein
LRFALGLVTLGLFWLPAALMRALRRAPGVRVDGRRPAAANGDAFRTNGGAAAPDGERPAPEGGVRQPR